MRLITVDTSAIVAILLDEPASDAIQRILYDSRPQISSASLLECYMRIKETIGDPSGLAIDRTIDEFDLTVTEFGLKHLTYAQIAFDKYGKGRHPARLNFGDCIVYATSKLSKSPILCLGNDFAQTDASLVEIPV